MQPIFREAPAHPSLATEDGEACLQLPLIRFEVPADAVPSRSELLVTADAPATGDNVAVATVQRANKGRKRGREQTGEEVEGGTKKQERDGISRDSVRGILSFFEFGDQPHRPSKLLTSLLSSHASPAAALLSPEHHTSGTADGGASQKANALLLALRQALAIVCRIVRLDTDGLFLLSVAPSSPSPSPSSASGVPPPPPPPSGVGEMSGKRRHGFLQLYCVLGGVKLELEDNMAQLATLEESGDAVGRRPALLRQLEATQSRVEAYLDAFEGTVTRILLDDARFAGGVAPARGYVAPIVRSLPDIFKEEAWPVQVLGASEVQASRRQEKAADESSASPLEHARDALGEGTTAIVLAALRDVERADRCHALLTEAERPNVPITVTVAKLCLGALHKGPTALDLESTTFSELKARAWCGHFGRLGLRRADAEMRLLIHSLLLASMETASAPTTTSTRKSDAAQRQLAAERCHELLALKWRWTESLDRHYRAFLREQDIDGDQATNLCFPADVFDLARCFRSTGKERTKVQEAAVGVVKALKAIDKEGWFAVPAFDLVNVDFSSVKCWVESPSFTHLSGRAAFDALRRVLERMVDACVQKYGPTHPFSLCIVAVRQQLVDAARREGLLA